MGKDWLGLGKVTTGAQEGVAVGQALISEQSTEGSELPQYLQKLKTATLGDFFFYKPQVSYTERQDYIEKKYVKRKWHAKIRFHAYIDCGCSDDTLPK